MSRPLCRTFALVLSLLLVALPAASTAQEPTSDLATLRPPEPRLLVGTPGAERQNILRAFDIRGEDVADLTDARTSVTSDGVGPGGSLVAFTTTLHTLEMSDAWGSPRQVLARERSTDDEVDLRGDLLFDYSPTGDRLAYADDRLLRILDLDSGVDRAVVSDPWDGITNDADLQKLDLVWLADDWLLLQLVDYSDHQSTVHSRFFEISRGRSFPADTSEAQYVPSPRGDAVVVRTSDRLAVHDADDLPSLDAPRWTRNVESASAFGPIQQPAARWSPGGDLVAFATENTAHVVDSGNGTNLTTFGGGDARGVTTPVFAPNGARVAATLVGHGAGGTPTSIVTAPAREDGTATTVVPERDGEQLVLLDWLDDERLLVSNTAARPPYAVSEVEDAEGTEPMLLFEPDSDVSRPTVIRPRFGPVDRYAGVTRVSTATTLSRAAFADGTSSVVVARADLYPDALAGSALAGDVDGPLLLTSRDGLDDEVTTEIRRLEPSTAYVLGTTDVMSSQVEQDLRDAGVDEVVRIGGATRFDTAGLIANRVSDADTEHVFLVEGQDPDPSRGWPDAVSVAGRAAASTTPVLLTETDRLHDATTDALDRLDVTHITIVGGPVAVSQQVEEELEDLGYRVDRLAGPTRYATSVAVAQQDADVRLPFVVTGSNWPDALAAGPAAAAVGGTVLLAPPDSITSNDATERFLNTRADEIDRVAIAGSTGAVSQRIVRELAELVE